MLKNTISNTQVICVKLMFTVNQFISAFLFLPLFFRDAVTKTTIIPVTERLTLVTSPVKKHITTWN